MKRINFLIALFCYFFIVTNIYGQSRWCITPYAGMTFSKFRYKGDEYLWDKYTDSKIGWTIGADVEYRVFPWLGVSSGLDLSVVGGKEKHDYTLAGMAICQKLSKQSGTLSYLSLPLMLNFHIYKGLSLKSGVKLAFLFNARACNDLDNYYHKEFNPEADPNQSTAYISIPEGVTHNFPDDYYLQSHEREKHNITGDMQRLDLQIPVAFAYEYQKFRLQAEYDFGIYVVRRVGGMSGKKWTYRDDVSRFHNAENRFLKVTLGYKFAL